MHQYSAGHHSTMQQTSRRSCRAYPVLRIENTHSLGWLVPCWVLLAPYAYNNVSVGSSPTLAALWPWPMLDPGGDRRREIMEFGTVGSGTAAAAAAASFQSAGG